jgi:signal transduction protein with GAF and PtsI domain
MNTKPNYEEENKILRMIIGTVGCHLDLERVLNGVIEIVTQGKKGVTCLIYLFDKTNEELILHASNNPHLKVLDKIKINSSEEIIRVIKEKKPVVISKEVVNTAEVKLFYEFSGTKYHFSLYVPIIHKDEVIGLINVLYRQPDKPSSDETVLIFTIAQYIGFAIENARLYEETKERASRLETLTEVSSTIVSNRYLKEILQLIVTMTAEMMKSKICSIMLLDEKKQVLFIEATQSLSEEYIKKPPLKIGEGISGKAVKEKRPITVLDVTREPEYKYREIAKKEGICSMLAVPMMIKDKVVGVINSYTASEHKFTEDEIKILQSIANQAAVAIENTKLMEEILSVREALEVRKLVERAKGILMKELGIDEDTAYRKIHRQSMNTGKPMKEIAEAIILSSEIKKKI